MSKHILTILLAIMSVSATADEVELVCKGTVNWDNDSFSDELVLQISDKEIEVSGAAGQRSTFEGGLPYKICSKSKNEIEFEYTTQSECGKDHTGLARYGYLQKVLGTLKLKKTLDGNQPFYGDYKCKPASRVLN